MSILALVGVAMLTLAIAGVIYQSVGLAHDARRFPPPGRLVDVGGHRLHAVCCGHGTPMVVLESAIAASSLSWARVQPDVARFTSVCAYDRAGLGWSDPPTRPRSFARIVDELHACLTNLQCAPPYVMVGHSFGVFVCLTYAARHPQRVSGLILVDPPTEWAHVDHQQLRLLWGAVQFSRLGGLLARLGVVRVCLRLLTGGAPAAPRHFVRVFGTMTARTLERLVGEVRKLPPEIHPVVESLWCRPKCFQAMADHLRVFQEATASVAAIASLGDVPLVVISSADKAPHVTASHHALARMSSQGHVVCASKSGHWVPYDEPALIVETIREVVETVRRGYASNASAARLG
jgi:pimeloyl-ACP methyl ester carboxylesterase